MAVTKKYLLCVNFLTGLIGMAIMGGSIWGLVKFDSDFKELEYELIDESALYFMLGGGILVFLISFLGCAGTQLEKPNFLCAYIFFLLVGIGLQAGMLFAWSSFMGTLDESSSRTREAAAQSGKVEMIDGLLSTYVTCCSGCEDKTICQDLDGGEKNLPRLPENDPYCPVGKCDLPKRCNDSLVDADVSYEAGCFVEAEDFPPYDISNAVCQALTKLENPKDSSQKLVGYANNSYSCGGGSPEKWMENVYGWLDDKGTVLNIMTGILVGIQVIALLFAAFTMINKHK